MTDWYVNGYRITLVSLRGGAKVIVVRAADTNRYMMRFEDAAEFHKWLNIFAKEYGSVKAQRKEKA